jgi:CDP-paratose 2-epimerase
MSAGGNGTGANGTGANGAGTNGTGAKGAHANGAATNGAATNGAHPAPPAAGPSLVIGGAGFVGSNLADRLLRDGREVVVFDNLARPGVERNLAWLRRAHGERLTFVEGDVRDRDAVGRAVRDGGGAGAAADVFHFAAQVAVTTSLGDPADDFEVNARGTLNVLEAVRALRDATGHAAPVLFTSTNKVYGELADVAEARTPGGAPRYAPADAALAATGISEARPLDFHSPYGCSKGAADQYVCDYARSYGLPTVVFRMSCIYGPRQFGTEDQGWVAHFLIRALDGQAVTLYGDGLQVRDVLFVDDLVEAFLLARRHATRLAGRAFNIGGGPANTTSLLELVERIGGLTGRAPDVRFEGWRTGDQRWYVSDVRAFGAVTGWQPRTSLGEGLARLHDWLVAQRADAAEAEERALVGARA